MSRDEQLIQQLQNENRQLKQELGELASEKEVYRKVLQKLLPVENFDYDEAELKDLLAHPEKYQTLREFLGKLESEFANHA